MTQPRITSSPSEMDKYSIACEGYLFFLLLALLINPYAVEAQKKYVIDSKVTVVDARISPFDKVIPGDTLFLAPGPRQPLLIYSFRGEKGNPVVFMNFNGKVTFDTDHYFAISLHDCQHIRLSGEGDPDHFYGIQINRVSNGAGIGIGSLSTDYEIDHISIENVKTAGIFAKTDPDCSLASVRGRFLQSNTIIRDNYIANAGVEGLYVGSTQYFGQRVSCNGKDTLLMPNLLEGVSIYNNIVKNSGWDGIQISSASGNCRIYNNTILYDSQAGISGQMAGILIGGGSRCDCYNNFISNGNGNGIEIHGTGGFRVFNNIILKAGRSFFPDDLNIPKHGIFVTDVSAMADSTFTILFNHIIDPKSDGIRFQSQKSKKNLIVSNLIINPGNYDFYEQGNFWYKGKDAYVFIPNPATEVTIKNNFMARNLTDARLNENDYTPLEGSPLIDAGFPDNARVDFDFRYHPRPMGLNSDVGAFETDFQTRLMLNLRSWPDEGPLIYPNPARSHITVDYPSDGIHQPVLLIYDKTGRPLVNEVLRQETPGLYSIKLDIRTLTTGIYLYSLTTKLKTFSGKLIITP
jgi:parallel beta-helix repeat protein